MSQALSASFRTIYDLAFQVSPIFLQGGIAASVPYGMLPVIALTGQIASFAQSALLGQQFNIEDFFARFVPLPGASVVSQSVGMYPFANQAVAGNATIQNPLAVSLRMIAPVKSPSGYLTKLPILSALSSSFRQHNNAGGTYVVATPSKIYDTMIMLDMIDIPGDQRQQQIEWQLDFVAPLISQQSAQAAYNGLMSKISGGQMTSPTSGWGGSNATLGSSGAGGITQQMGIAGLFGSISNFLSSPAI